MNNYEHYQKEIIEILETGVNVGIKHNKPANCESLSCFACDLHNLKASCKSNFAKWLKEEYKPQKIDWTKVPKFTKVRVMNGRNLKPYYFLGVADDGDFLTTKCDEYTYSEGGFVRCKYCKLDESVDPTPYIKEN